MKRILAVAYTEYLSDPRVRREAEALAERGDDVTVLCLAEHGRLAEEVVRGVRLVRLKMARYRGAGMRSYLMGYGQFFLRAFAWMASHPVPDVVHVHTIPDALVFSALVPRLRGSRVVLDVHDLTPDLFALKFGDQSAAVRALRAIERGSLDFADAVITVHEPYAGILAERGVARDRLHVVMNVPDESIFAPLDGVERTTGSEQVTFVYHGALVERYGPETLLRAFSAARAHVPAINLRVFGGGDFRSHALHVADELGLNGSVAFSPGYVPVDALPKLLADTDVGVVPNHANAFTRHILPTKLMEYAALGMPTIVSRTETVPAYFTDQMVRYVEPADVDDLASAMVELAIDPLLRARLAQAIRDFTARHSWAATRHVLFDAIDGAPVQPGGSD